MASEQEVHRLPMTRPPPHLEGNLVFHRPTKFGRTKRAFFVLLETVIYQYESRGSYHRGHISKDNIKISLEEVCGITSTEINMSSSQYKNCSFKLTLNDKQATEYIFSADSRQAMEEWVSGLREAKEFWIQRRKRKEFALPVPVHNEADIKSHVEDNISSGSSENCEPVQVSVTTWDGVTRKVLLPCVFDMEELLSALATKLQNKQCPACPICKLQQSSMEVWTVTANGIGHKLDTDGGLDVSKHGQHFYLLVHNYKLLIIHFEDGTFQVLPWVVSLKAKQVPYLPIFADKLASLGFSNFGLFLVNEKGTSFPFTPDEEPLKHSFQGRFILKNKALNVTEPTETRSLEIQKQKLKRHQQNRRNQKALKIAEKEKCKQPSHFSLGNTISEGFTPPDGLVFDFDHYGDSGDSKQPSVLPGFVENFDSTGTVTDENDALTEARQSTGSSSNSQAGHSSIDGRPGSHERTDKTTQEEGEGECTEVPLSEQSGSSMQGSEAHFDEHSSSGTYSLGTNEQVPNGQGKESLKLPQCSAGNVLSPDQKEESTKAESIGFHRDGSLSNGSETCKTKNSRVPASNDDNNGKIVPTSISGKKRAETEPCLIDNRLVNYSNETSVLIDDETIEQGSNENGHDGATGEVPAQTESNHETTLPISAASSDDVPSSVPDETPDDTTEIHETVPVDIHQCDFTTVGSPRVLELVLKVCSGQKANEEEVGEANQFSRICLSGWHLRCKNGSWVVVERGKTHEDADLSSVVKIQFTEGLEALFHKEEKRWTVVENEHVANRSDVVETQIQDQDVTDTSATAEGLSSYVTLQDPPVTPDLSPNKATHQNDNVTFLPDVVETQIQNQGVNDSLATAEASPSDASDRPVTPDLSPNNATYQADNVTFLPNIVKSQIQNQDVTLQDRPVMPDLRPNNATHQDDNVTFSPFSSLQAQESPFRFKTRKIAENYETKPSSKAELSNQEALHAAIHQIFQRMTKSHESPEEALKHENITESICNPLCNALWNILSVGLRKKLFVKYTVWNVVEEFKGVSSHVRRIVDWVHKKYATLGERQKFQAFVCECLNIGKGALHHWFESILSQNRKRLDKYYSSDGMVVQLSRENVEQLVLDLSRISSLPFELNFERCIKMQGHDLNQAAFTFE